MELGTDPLAKIKDQALLLLKFRPRSEREMRERLLRKKWPPETVEALLEEFKKKGLIDDIRFARYFSTQQLLSKPVGRRLLLNSLKARGVDSDVASSEVERACEGKEEVEMAREVARSRLPSLKGLNQQAAQRRLFGFLSRRGFSSDVVYRVVREFKE